MRIIQTGTVVAAMLLGAASNLNGESDSVQATALSRFLDVIDVVLDQHIDPPTRQQMVLDGTKALYASAKRQVPKDLSQRVSDLTSRDQLLAFLEQQRVEFHELNSPEAVLVEGLLRTLSGGGRIVLTQNLKVQGQLNANRYVGTGIVLGMDSEAKRPVINKVFHGGPAWKAGARDGDLLLEIGGANTAAMQLSDVVPRLRGEAGTELTLKVKQQRQEHSRELKVTLGVAFIPTVEGYRQVSAGEWKYLVEPDEEVAYIRINRIGSSTVHELRRIEDKLRGTQLRGLILDLRFGGATLHDTILVADALLDGGRIGYVQTRDSRRHYEATTGALFRELPLAVLVDQHISAGNEFLAAALQDLERAQVVGERTSGSAYVRQGIPLPGRDEELIIATGILQRGDGTPLLIPNPGRALAHATPIVRVPHESKKTQTPQVVPNYPVQITPQERRALSSAYSYTRPGLAQPVDDPVLAKAVKVLRSQVEQVGSDSEDDGVSG